MSAEHHRPIELAIRTPSTIAVLSKPGSDFDAEASSVLLNGVFRILRAAVSARHGLAWYEIDLKYYGIWIMGRLGLAKKINVPTIAQMAIASPGFPATGSNCD